MAVDIVSYRRTICYGLFALIQVSCVATETECFYYSGILLNGGFQLLDSFMCEHGCCGTTEHQKCCEKPNEDGTVWKLAAIALVSCVVILTVTLVCCCILKKKNKATMRVRNRNNGGTPSAYRDRTDIFAMSYMQGEPFPKPPPYSYRDPSGSAGLHNEDNQTEIAGSSRDTPAMTDGYEDFAYTQDRTRTASRDNGQALPPPYVP